MCLNAKCQTVGYVPPINPHHPASRSGGAGVGRSAQLPCQPFVTKLSRTVGTFHSCLSISRDAMASAETLEGSNVLLLPEDFLVDIASMLDLKEGCQMERASRGVHDILSRPSYPWPAKRGLNLYHFERPLSSEAFRSFAYSASCFWCLNK